MFMIADGRETFYQWDINQKLIVTDSTVKEVHFCNKTDDCSLVCEVRQEDGKRVVDVPNILLQTAWDIRAYAYTGEATKLEARYKVLARTKPTDYIYTETEVLKWEQLEQELIAEVEDLISTVEEIVADSSASADNANALLGSKRGEVITIGDASPIKKDIAVKVASKNILPYPYVDGEGNVSRHGLTFTDNGDGSITVNGTASQIVYYNVFTKTGANYLDFKDFKSGTYTISGCPSGGGGTTYKMQLTYFTDESASRKWVDDIGNNISVTINGTAPRVAMMLVVYSGMVCDNLTFYPQIEEGTTATAYTPYIEDISTVEVTACGANLLNWEDREVVDFGGTANTTIRKFTGKGIIKGFAYNNYLKKSCITAYEKTESGVGFSSTVENYGIGFDLKAKPNTEYIVDGDGLPGDSYLSEYDKDGKYLRYAFSSTTTNGNGRKFVTGADTAWIVISVQNRGKVNEMVYYNNLFVGLAEFSTYEPYKEPITYTVDAEGRTLIEPIQPTTTLMATTGAIMQADYNKDINKAYQELYNAIISLGGNI